MTLGIFEQPHIHAEHCVGCGLCEQACVKMPQAIRTIPFAEVEARPELLEKKPSKPRRSHWHIEPEESPGENRDA